MTYDPITAASDRSALTVQRRQTVGGRGEVVLTWREEEATLVDALEVAVVPWADEKVLEKEEEMTL